MHESYQLLVYDWQMGGIEYRRCCQLRQFRPVQVTRTVVGTEYSVHSVGWNSRRRCSCLQYRRAKLVGLGSNARLVEPQMSGFRDKREEGSQPIHPFQCSILADMKHYPSLLSQSVPKNFARSLADRHGQAGSRYAVLVCFGSVWFTDSTARAHKTPMKQVNKSQEGKQGGSSRTRCSSMRYAISALYSEAYVTICLSAFRQAYVIESEHLKGKSWLSWPRTM